MSSKLVNLYLLIVFHFGFLLTSSNTQSYGNGCRTPDGTEATCVGLWQCPPLLNLLKTLKRPHSPELTKKLNAYKCNGRNKICCPSEPIIIDNHEIPYHNREAPPDVTNHKNFRLLPEECGFLDSSIRITHGEDAALTEFPWMAVLRYKTAHGQDFLCGGTIINYNYILTAAHCLGLKDAELVSVRVGEYSIRNTTDCEIQDDYEKTLKCNPPVQDLKVEEIISHPQFLVNDKHILNDIALLRVSRIKKAENAYPVCLPVGEMRDWPFRSVYVTGWGLTNSQTHTRPDILQKVGLPIVNKQTCATTYSESGIELTKSQICAGGVKGKASCSGDSGGPMLVAAVIEGNFIYVQHGIVSVGPSFCGIRGYPGVYTLVTFYMDWILDHMRP